MGILDKLKILAFSDDTFLKPAGMLQVSINPESYTHNHSVQFSDKKNVAEGAGNSGKFNTVDTETVGFSIHFDGTGVTDAILNVDAQILLFKKVAYNYNGKIHRTNYLVLSWGTLLFYCYLTKLDITYTMFDSYGLALRAKADVSFSGFTNSKLLAASANKGSPDVNHLKTFKSHDSILLFCDEVYDDSGLYMEVAKANDLDSFRDIPVGTQLVFPALKK